MWEKDLGKFKVEMRNKLRDRINSKGSVEKADCYAFSEIYLIEKLKEHLNAENYIDVANYAFLLWQNKTYTELLDNLNKGEK